MDKYVWIAVLDSKTTAICQNRDGEVYTFGEGPLPPAHLNCRSSIMAYDGTPVEIPASMADWIDAQPDREALAASWLQAFDDQMMTDTRRVIGKLIGDTGEVDVTKIETTAEEKLLADIKRLIGDFDETTIVKQAEADAEAEAKLEAERQAQLEAAQNAQREAARQAAADRVAAIQRKSLEEFQSQQRDRLGLGKLTINTDTSVAFETEVQKAWDELPAGIKALLKDTRVVASARLTDVLPDLAGKTPRGWSKGSTWEMVDGVYSQGNKTAVVSETAVNRYSGRYEAKNRATGVLYHELGHAVDDALHDLSARESLFGQAYAQDVADYFKANPGATAENSAFGYYLQAGDAGKSEMFAEMFASVLGNNAGGLDLPEAFPRVAAYMRNLLKGFG